MEEQERDPLALVLALEDDQPLPPGAGDDPEVARALADVALIRRQLGVLAGALTAEPVPAAPVVRPRRRGRIAAWALAACVALGVLGTGGAWLAAHPGTLDSGGIDSGGSSAKLTAGGFVACATDVAEGTVARVEPLADEGELRVVLRVERRYKPEGAGSGELAFRGGAADPSFYRPGARMLVVVSRFPDEGALTFRQDMEPPGELGEDVGPVRDELEYGRAWVEKGLREGVGDCPGRG
ncbi:hypothetical protein GCM10017562_26770 [Streptomyces roseofulvus]|uniref:Anti-sigma factor n=2 Tax=Streptomyces TaxID=1883 RepID=A0ABU4K275_9ACTN|nr:hypothetical protein [Streptomyces roseolus]MDX2291855.1 hypothetical protein [Streptomyces roseolus]